MNHFAQNDIFEKLEVVELVDLLPDYGAVITAVALIMGTFLWMVLKQICD